MSLQINQEKVTRVLLADGWHDCLDFGLDAYEFGSYHPDEAYSSGVGFDCTHGGGQSGVCATGFAFTDRTTGQTVAGPLTAILAVQGDRLTAEPSAADVLR